MIKYLVLRKCWWNTRLWKPGETPVLPDDVEPPHHFKKLPQAQQPKHQVQPLSLDRQDQLDEEMKKFGVSSEEFAEYVKSNGIALDFGSLQKALRKYGAEKKDAEDRKRAREKQEKENAERLERAKRKRARKPVEEKPVSEE